MPVFNLHGIPVVILSRLDNIAIDMVSEVTVDEPSRITEHPTESGANVSDHIINLPVSITLSGRFSDVPLSTAGLDLPNPFAPLASQLSSMGTLAGLSVQKWNALEALRDGKIPFTVVIQHGVYNNMAFRDLRSPRVRRDGSSMQFTADLQQLVVVDLTDLLGGVRAAPSVNPTSSPSVGRGQQNAVPVAP